MDPRENLENRRLVVAAYVAAVEARDAVMAAVAASSGDDDARARVAAVLAVDEIRAQAVLDMQLRRFSREQIERLRDELDDIDGRLAALPPG